MHGEKKEFKFGKRADKYDVGIEGKFLKKFYDYMKEFVELKENDRVLDVACGTGAMLECFKDKGIVGYGIDIDEKMGFVYNDSLIRGRVEIVRFKKDNCKGNINQN